MDKRRIASSPGRARVGPTRPGWVPFVGWLLASGLAVYIAIQKITAGEGRGQVAADRVNVGPTMEVPPASAYPGATPDRYLYPTWQHNASADAVAPPASRPTTAAKATSGLPSTAAQTPSTPGSAATPAQVQQHQSTPEPRYGLDAERDKAAFLRPALDRLVQDRDRLATLEADYGGDCEGEVYPRGDRSKPPVRLSDTPACERKESTIHDLQSSLWRECAAVKEEARKGRVIPGILRELVAARTLEHCVQP